MPRHDDVRRLGRDRPRRVGADHPPRARRRDQLRGHRRRLLAGRVGGDRRQGARRWPARQRGPGHQGPREDGGRPQRVRQLPRLDRARGREQPAPAGHRLDRPLPDPPPRGRHRHRGDPRRAHRPRAGRQGPLHRLVDLPAQPDRRGPVGVGAADAGAFRHRAAALLAAQPRRRVGRAAHLRAPRHRGHPLEPAGRGVAVGQVSGRRPPGVPPQGAGAQPVRHVDSREPAQAGGRPRSRRPGRRGGPDA